MRVWSRIALVVTAVIFASSARSDHQVAECPLSLSGSTSAVTSFDLSPHGVFRSDDLVYVLRGQALTTYTTTNAVGELEMVREDVLAALAGRDNDGAVAFSNGHLFVSSEAGLEIFDLNNVGPAGSAPIAVHSAPGIHFTRMAVNGNRLVGLTPTEDLPCYPTGSALCTNDIFILDISTLTNPFLAGQINSRKNQVFRGFNDVAFVSGILIATTEQSTVAFDITNPANPMFFASTSFPGRWLATNGIDVVAVGTDSEINVFDVRLGRSPYFLRSALLPIPSFLRTDRANEIRFSRNASWDETTSRLITMIEEVDPQTLEAARTIAFDVFDMTVPRFEGSAERIYENVTETAEDEVKHNPIAVGNYVYVIGERSGIQAWGACGIAAGQIELNRPQHLVCGGAEIHGWVTGAQRIVNVELFLDDTPLGAAVVGGTRHDISSPTPVSLWRVNVNLDQTERGEYTLRAVATDSLGNRRQFASQTIFFEGPGQNCSVPRRRAAR